MVEVVVVVELSEVASIFCQGNTIISVTRPPTTRQAKREERDEEDEREKEDKGWAYMT